MKNPAHLYEVSFFSALWMVFPESWKRRVADFYAHDCIYSWSIGHILEHEFFCLGHLGCAGSKGKKVDLRNSEQLFRVFFSTFGGQKKF